MPGVYISYPFCSQKCTYCNFASGVMPASLEIEYIDALAAEISAHDWKFVPDTVYFGGGTPSRMDAGTLQRILAGIPGYPWTEATMEAAPGKLAPAMWRDHGINRVSLGVQSFIENELRQTGRKHTAEVVEKEVAELRAAGIENINIDLIAGLAYQTEASWRESLDWVERLDPPHVSVYMLEVDEDSRLGLEILGQGSRYGARHVPNDDLAADLYEIAVDRLPHNRYEISNFARPGWESRHNLKYWRLHPYVGFGADAHGFDGHLRTQNVETANEYVARWKARQTVRLSTAPASLAEERFFVRLRLLEGVKPARDEWARFERPISRMLGEGLLEREGAALRLTRRGVLLSNEVFQEFLT